jgi:hypothetical protein
MLIKVADFVKAIKRCCNLWRSAAPELRTFPFYRNTHDNENHGHLRLQSRAESCLETKDWFGAEGRDISMPAIQWQEKGCSAWQQLHSVQIGLRSSLYRPIPAAARSVAWVCGLSLAGIMGSNPADGIDVSLVSVVFWQVEVSVSSWSLARRSTTDRMCVCVCVCHWVWSGVTMTLYTYNE